MVVELVLVLISSLWLMQPSAAAPPMAKLGCNDSCGGVTIPYPFGFGAEQCYLEKWFEITCKGSANKPPKPFLTRFDLEVLSISLYYQNVTVNVPVVRICNGDPWRSANLTGSPFRFSVFNKFTVRGCGNALLTNQSDGIVGGCATACNSNIITDGNITDGNIADGCYGINCCRVSISSGLTIYNITTDAATEDCMSSFLSYSRGSPILGDYSNSSTPDGSPVPVLLDWMMSLDNLHGRLRSSTHFCSNQTSTDGSTYYYCECNSTYEGNPYISNGCQVVEACRGCKGRCVMTDYIFTGDGIDYVCYCDYRKSLKAVILGASISGGLMFLLLGGFWLYKVIRKIRETRLKKKFFKRNGGLLLQQQMLLNEGVDKLFTSKELQKVTDNFNKNRILGHGGQGTVYKGMLTDGRIIAIKKSKLVDENQLEQFINEVVILSHINHRNIVKLLGYCLETEVPLLVYEFIPNGTLFELIHDQNKDFPLSWERRLQIATEVAGALAYLHSASSVPIYHRDIKSTNILLDDKYGAKVSDFGTSRSIAIEQTHLTTVVHGTFGYLDPEYFQSSQFTDKSDVHSFGVVLVELLTGQKPICSTRSLEEKSLATHFVLSLKETRLFDILDAQVMKEGGKEEIVAVANIAKRCLNLNGKKRPTMKEVTMELEAIRMSYMPSSAPQNFKEGECNIVESHMPLSAQQNFQESECVVELTGPFDGFSTSTRSSSLGFTRAVPSDDHPLLDNTV